MKNLGVVIVGLVLLTGVTGCSSMESGLLGGVLGVGAAGGGYEYHLKRQKDPGGGSFQGEQNRIPRSGVTVHRLCQHSILKEE